MKLSELKNYSDSFLEIQRFESDRFNGLKVRGRSEVNRLGFATNCTFEVIDKAIKVKIDFLFVHHGGWKETDSEFAKQKWDKLRNKKISLYIAHASLDCNKQFGTSLEEAYSHPMENNLPTRISTLKRAELTGTYSTIQLKKTQPSEYKSLQEVVT